MHQMQMLQQNYPLKIEPTSDSNEKNLQLPESDDLFL